MRVAPLILVTCAVSAFLFAAKPSDLKDLKKTAFSYGEQKFKVSGSASAPMTIEVYSDFQCPACRVLFLETLPPLMANYVTTGKVRLVHRDFPMPMHQFGKIAAKWANCAGTLGRYDLVSAQLFKTQPDWSQNGNIDGALTKVLPPGEIQKLRAMVADPNIDEGSAQDVAQGMKDRVNQTPTLVIVYKGKREPIGGITPFEILKRYIDPKLAQ